MTIQETTTVILPPDLKAAVQSEARQKAVSMAAVIRWALRDWYRRKETARAHLAHHAGSMTLGEVADRTDVLANRR